MLLLTILPIVVLGGCFVLGVLATMAVLLSYPVKLADQEGMPPIVTIVTVSMLTPIILFCIFAGAWFLEDILLLLLGMILGMPFCMHYAPYLDDLKAILCTPQRPGKRKREVPSYPKQERMQEEPLAYYEEMSQRY